MHGTEALGVPGAFWSSSNGNGGGCCDGGGSSIVNKKPKIKREYVSPSSLLVPTEAAVRTSIVSNVSVGNASVESIVSMASTSTMPFIIGTREEYKHDNDRDHDHGHEHSKAAGDGNDDSDSGCNGDSTVDSNGVSNGDSDGTDAESGLNHSHSHNHGLSHSHNHGHSHTHGQNSTHSHNHLDSQGQGQGDDSQCGFVQDHSNGHGHSCQGHSRHNQMDPLQPPKVIKGMCPAGCLLEDISRVLQDPVFDYASTLLGKCTRSQECEHIATAKRIRHDDHTDIIIDGRLWQPFVTEECDVLSFIDHGTFELFDEGSMEFFTFLENLDTSDDPFFPSSPVREGS
jgi:hypothetical protein